MSSGLKSLARWSAKPARGVQTSSSPSVNIVRGLFARATTPLLPDDYSKLVNPLWTARELRGRVIDVTRETEDTATLRIRPGWGFSASYQPGQYVGIGLRVEGRWHWRSYSLTSVPRRRKKLISITVKATPEGFLSTHLVKGVQPGTIVRLAAPKGDFTLPNPPAEKLLFITAGSGITPVMAMLRTLARRDQNPDVVHIHSAPAEGDVIFRTELKELEGSGRSYRLHLQLTEQAGKFDLADLDDVVPDWKDRSTWACGPTAMLDAVESLYDENDRGDNLHTERFTIDRTDKGGEGGTVHFSVSDKTVELDGATSILEGGEQVGIQMPFGCRMGICQTCVLPLADGHVRDFRSGDEHEAGDRIQTCVSAVSGECTIDI